MIKREQAQEFGRRMHLEVYGDLAAKKRKYASAKSNVKTPKSLTTGTTARP